MIVLYSDLKVGQVDIYLSIQEGDIVIISEDNIRCLIRADYARRVRVNDNLTRPQAQMIIGQLREMDNLSNKPIVIEFNSDGGVHEAGVLLFENFQCLRSPTVGIVYGRCHSSAFLAFQGCSKRYAFRYVNIHPHNNYIALKVTPAQDENAAAEMIKERIRHLRAERSKTVEMLRTKLTDYSTEEIIELLNREQHFNGEQALERKFVDKLVEV